MHLTIQQRFVFLCLVLALLTTLLVACGGSGATSTPTQATSPLPTQPASPTQPPSPLPTPTETPCG